MWKAGAIIGTAAFLLVFVASFGLSPLCGQLCISPIAGAAAGYLAGVFQKPITGGAAAKSGAIAGAISGAGAFLGQTLAGVANALFAPQIAQFVSRMFGAVPDLNVTRMTALSVGVCGGLVDLAIMAGLGALFGYLSYQIVRSRAARPEPAPPSLK